jgi:heme A synthase
MEQVSKTEQPAYSRLLNISAKVLTFWAFVVVCVGGIVKSKEAGLTIPEPVYYEWNYWYVIADRVNTEYIHRALVGIMSFLTLWVAILAFVKDSRSSVRKLAIGLIVVLLAQATLGALTVKYFAHAQTSIPHAVMGQTFLCLALAMWIVTSRSWLSDAQPMRSESQPTLYRLSVYTVCALALQLLLGAALRHDDQGLALRNGREFVFVWHLVAHVAGALLVVYTVARLLFRVFHDHRQQRAIMLPTKILMMLLGVQFVLGPLAAVLKVTTLEDYSGPPPLRVLIATTHLAVGAAILALSVAVAMGACRFTVAASSPKPESSGQERLVGATA